MAIAVLGSCKDTPDDYQTVLGEEYFPLEVGKFVEYEMDSTIYDPNGDSTVSVSKTLLREEVVDTLVDNNGQLLYKVERYERASDTLPWVIKKVLSVSIQANQAIRSEDNLRFIKMTFPLKKGNSWDGNIHVQENMTVTVAGEVMEMFKGWNYKVTDLGEPVSVGSFQFDETLQIQEAENENLIELRRANAIYAKGIGLVYRELWILDTQCIDNCTGQPWEEKAEKGFILRQTILNHN